MTCAALKVITFADLPTTNLSLRWLVRGLVGLLGFAFCAGPLVDHGSAAKAAETGLPVASIERETPVRFQDEIVPMLSANCTACHNEKVTEGGLSMDSLERIVAGGDSGPGVVAGKAAESLLFLRAAHQLDDAMPPEDNSVGAVNLSAEQLGLLQKWIDEGAAAGPLAMQPVDWKPLPPGVGGVLAVALSADSRVTAAARGGRVTLFDTPSGVPLLPAGGGGESGVSLTDPTLAMAGSQAAGLAHADVITAMAFSPTQDLLATGSFRTIKLWERQPWEKRFDIPGSAGGVLLAVAENADRTAVVGLADGRIAVVRLLTDAAADSFHVLGSPGPAAVAGAISGDGTTLYVAAADQSVTAYRLDDGAVMGRMMRPHAISGVALSETAPRLVTAEADGVLRVWELPLQPPGEAAAAATLIREIAGAASPVVGLREHPTMAGHVFAGCRDGNVRLVNLEDGTVVREFAHGGPLLGLAVNPDGSRLATVGGVPGVKLWNTTDAALLVHTQGDFLLADRLAALDADLQVLTQDVEHGKAEVTAAEEAKKKAAEELTAMQEKLAAAEKDAGEKATAAMAATAARTEAESMATAAGEAVPLTEAAIAAAKQLVVEATTAVEAAVASRESFSKTNAAADAIKPLDAAVEAAKAAEAAATAAVAATEAQLAQAKKQVEEATKAVEEKKKAETTAVDASQAASTALTSAKRDHEFATMQVAKADENLPQRQAALTAIEAERTEAEATRGAVDEARTASQRPWVSVAFSGDGQRLLCLDPAGSVVECGGVDGLPRRSVAVNAGSTQVAVDGQGQAVVCGGPSMAAVWAPGERWTLVRTIGGELLPPAMDETLTGPPVDAVLALAFSPDGSLLASGSGRASRGGEIKLWNVADGTLARTFEQPHSDTVVSLAFSRDGAWLASGGTDRLAKMHDVAGGTTVRSFEGHTGHVLGVAWQANGRRLATAGADNVVKIWTVESGEQQRTIGGLGREVTGVRFIAEGEEIAATSGDATVRVFNAASGNEVRRLQGAGDFVQSVAIAGATLAAGSQDGRMLIWKVDNPQPLHTLEPSPAP